MLVEKTYLYVDALSHGIHRFNKLLTMAVLFHKSKGFFSFEQWPLFEENINAHLLNDANYIF